MSAILRPEFPAKPDPLSEAVYKPHRIPISGATPSDIAFTVDRVDFIFALFISALQGQLENLRESLPVSSLNNFTDIYHLACDLRSETLGRLEQLGEES